MKLNATRRVMALILAVLMVLGVAVVALDITVGATVTNYALGCTYTKSSAEYLSGKEDTGKLLTDGTVGNAETNGVTVAYAGTGKTYTLIFDLGEIKDDIKTIKFMNVCVENNRDFGADSVTIAVAKANDKASPETNTYTYEAISQYGTQYFNYIYTLSTEAVGRYVYITMSSPKYVLSLSEIEIWGSGVPADVEKEPVIPNYSKGTTYTPSSTGYLSNFEDTGSLLTDGVVALEETSGVTVAYVGSQATYTLVFDLGASKDDIKTVKFRNVRVSGNRDFGASEVQIAVTDSLDSSEPVMSTYTYVVEPQVGNVYFDFVYTLDMEAAGRYVYITMYSPGYVISLSEIEILGSPIVSDESGIIIPDPIDTTPRFDVVLSSVGEFKENETFELLCTVKNIKTNNGLVAVDFVVDYNNVAFEPAYPTGTNLSSQYIKTAPKSGNSLLWEDIGTYCDTANGKVYMRFAHKTAEHGDGVFNDGALVFKIVFNTKVSSGTYSFEATSCRGTDPGNASNKKLREIYANGSSCQATAVVPSGLVPTDPSITVSDGYVWGVAPGLTTEAFAAKFEGNVTVTSNGVGKKVGTGYIVTAESGESATVIVMGDVDGSGVIDATDYLLVKNQFMGLYQLTALSSISADIDKSGKINSTDYLSIKSHFLRVKPLY